MKIYLEEGQTVEVGLMKKLEDAAVFILEGDGVDACRAEVSLTLVEPEEIRELNAQYRNVDKVTDVLSFPQYENAEDMPQEGELCIGDVVICTDKIREQAEELGHSYEREFAYLFVHSILHLLGYDHMEEEERSLMREKEEETMEYIGLVR